MLSLCGTGECWNTHLCRYFLRFVCAAVVLARHTYSVPPMGGKFSSSLFSFQLGVSVSL